MPTQEKYLAYWSRRISEYQVHSQSLAQQVRSELSRLVRLLVDEFGATRVIVFGSLVKEDFSPESDIDLAVEGIPRDRYFTALAAVNHLSSQWVDLKPLEDLEPHFRQRVLMTGEVIYEKDVSR